MTEAQKGVAVIVLACSIWGSAPLYYHALAEVGSFEMMAHRTIWTAVLFGLIATLTRRWYEVRVLVTGPDRWRILAAAAFIAFNWYFLTGPSPPTARLRRLWATTSIPSSRLCWALCCFARHCEDYRP